MELSDPFVGVSVWVCSRALSFSFCTRSSNRAHTVSDEDCCLGAFVKGQITVNVLFFSGFSVRPVDLYVYSYASNTLS